MANFVVRSSENSSRTNVQANLPRDATAVWLRGEDVLLALPLPGKDLWRVMGPAPADEDITLVDLLKVR